MAEQTIIQATFGGYPIVQMDARKYPAAAGKANSYFAPCGPEAGKGFVLMFRRDVLKLSTDSGGSSELGFPTYGGGAHTFIVRLGGENPATLALPGLTFVRATNVSGHAAGDENSVMLVEFCDPAKLVEDRNAFFRMYNVRAAAGYFTDANDADNYSLRFDTNSLDGGDPFDWSAMLVDIWQNAAPQETSGNNAQLNGSGTSICSPGLGQTSCPSMPYSPDGKPQNWYFAGVPRWTALNRVLRHIYCAPCRNPITGAWTFVRLGATQTGLAALESRYATRLMFDADIIHNYSLSMGVLACWWRRQNTETMGDEKEFGDTHSTPINQNDFINELAKPLDDLQGVSSTFGYGVRQVWDDLPGAYAQAADIPGANTNLEARNAAFGAKWYDASTVPKPAHRIYKGLLPDMLPGSENRAVIWRNYGDGWHTEIIKYTGYARRLMSGDSVQPWHECEEMFGVPEPQLDGVQAMPRHTQLVIVETNTPTASTLWEGKVHCSQGYGQKCWIKIFATDASAITHLVPGAIYVGRLFGRYTYAGENRPIFVVDDLKGIEQTTLVTGVTLGGTAAGLGVTVSTTTKTCGVVQNTRLT